MSTGVNVEKLNMLRQDLLDYVERLNVIFNEIDVQYAVIQASIDGSSRDIIATKYNDIKGLYETIKGNVMTYVEDLGKVKSGYEEIVEDLSNVVISDITKVTERS